MQNSKRMYLYLWMGEQQAQDFLQHPVHYLTEILLEPEDKLLLNWTLAGARETGHSFYTNVGVASPDFCVIRLSYALPRHLELSRFMRRAADEVEVSREAMIELFLPQSQPEVSLEHVPGRELPPIQQ